MADLVQPHTSATMRLVECERLQQPGTQRRAQHALFHHQRVGDGDRLGRQLRFGQRAGGQKGVWHGFGNAETKQYFAHQPPALLVRRQAAVNGGLWHRLAELFIAMVACNFFDYVDFIGGVEPPGGQHNTASVPHTRHRVADWVE